METNLGDRRATVLGALALIAGPALMLIADLIEPTVQDWEDPSAVLDLIAAQTTRWNFAGVVWFFAGLLLLAGLVTASRRLRRHRAGLGLAAGILAPLVPLAVMLWSMLGLATHEALAATSADRAQMVALWERTEQTALGALPLLLELLGTVGLLVLVVGLWRSKVVKVWVPLVILLGVVITFSATGTVTPLLGWTVLLAGFTAVAVRIMPADTADSVSAPAMSAEPTRKTLPRSPAEGSPFQR